MDTDIGIEDGVEGKNDGVGFSMMYCHGHKRGVPLSRCCGFGERMMETHTTYLGNVVMCRLLSPLHFCGLNFLDCNHSMGGTVG